MKDLIIQIQDIMKCMSKDLDIYNEKGTKASGLRVRKASLQLGNMLKDFRKKSIEAEKQGK